MQKDWLCDYCTTPNDFNLTKCVACEEYRNTADKLNSSTIKFGVDVGTASNNLYSGDQLNLDVNLFGKIPKFGLDNVALDSSNINNQKLDNGANNDLNLINSDKSSNNKCDLSKNVQSGRITFGTSDLSENHTVLVSEQKLNEAEKFCMAMNTPLKLKTAKINNGDPLDLPDKSTYILPASDCSSLYTWGSDLCDQLAVKSIFINEDFCCPDPKIVKAFNRKKTIDVVCGTLSTYAMLKEEDESNNEMTKIYSWGCSDDGCLGRPFRNHYIEEEWTGLIENNNFLSGKVPAEVIGLPQDDKIVKLTAGDSHAVVLTESGSCYAWGKYRDYTGPLGFWSDNKFYDHVERPRKIELPGIAIDICSGENHTVVLCEQNNERKLVVWGSTEFGQIGLKPVDRAKNNDLAMSYLKPFELKLSEFNFYLNADDSTNDSPNLLLMTNNDLIKQNSKILRIFSGKCTTFILLEVRSQTYIFGFGRNASGELGAGFKNDCTHEPVLLKIPSLCTLTDLKGGDYTTTLLSSDGSVWCWGRNTLNGSGLIEGCTCTPTVIFGLKNKVSAIGVGAKTNYAISFDGRVIGWGENDKFQIHKDSSVYEQLLPFIIPKSYFDHENISKITAGAQHVVALASHSSNKRPNLDENDEYPEPKKIKIMTSDNISVNMSTPVGIVEPQLVVTFNHTNETSSEKPMDIENSMFSQNSFVKNTNSSDSETPIPMFPSTNESNKNKHKGRIEKNDQMQTSQSDVVTPTIVEPIKETLIDNVNHNNESENKEKKLQTVKIKRSTRNSKPATGPKFVSPRRTAKKNTSQDNRENNNEKTILYGVDISGVDLSDVGTIATRTRSKSKSKSVKSKKNN